MTGKLSGGGLITLIPCYAGEIVHRSREPAHVPDLSIDLHHLLVVLLDARERIAGGIKDLGNRRTRRQPRAGAQQLAQVVVLCLQRIQLLQLGRVGEVFLR